MKWVSLSTVFKALAINEPKVAQKANYLFYGAFFLLIGVGSFGGYFMYTVLK